MPHVDLEGTANPMLRTHGDISLGSGKTKRANEKGFNTILACEGETPYSD